MKIEKIESVEIGTGVTCAICGTMIKAGESHNENVLVNDDGEIIKVLNSFHYECD